VETFNTYVVVVRGGGGLVVVVVLLVVVVVGLVGGLVVVGSSFLQFGLDDPGTQHAGSFEFGSQAGGR